jgi:hypothetical protein
MRENGELDIIQTSLISRFTKNANAVVPKDKNIDWQYNLL